jgi:chromosome segregation ATPase
MNNGLDRIKKDNLSFIEARISKGRIEIERIKDRVLEAETGITSIREGIEQAEQDIQLSKSEREKVLWSIKELERRISSARVRLGSATQALEFDDPKHLASTISSVRAKIESVRKKTLFML